MTVIDEEAEIPMKVQETTRIIEAILFASPNAVPIAKLASMLGEEVQTREIRKLIEILNQEYEHTNRVFQIEEVAKGFQMRTRKQYRSWIQKAEAIKPIKLSLATMETLAIIAYKQPLTRVGIEYIRGVDSSYTLRTLLKKRLIKVLGKAAVPGKPSLYGTTKLFLEVFQLKDIQNLPSLSELDMADSLHNQLELPLTNS